MNWENKVESVTVRRDSEGEIRKISVMGVRERTDRYSRIEYTFVYRVDDDGTATLWQIQVDNKVIARHLMALLPIVEDAVRAVPDVQEVEFLEDAIGQRRAEVAEDE